MRIGAVNYLNSKPLVCGLENSAPGVRLTYDLPSRLADSLAAGRLDVALIPCIEFFRAPAYRVVSDACVACRGPVLSVKLFFRVPPAEVRSLALDEGSRTSAALSKILLAELAGRSPSWEVLPIGDGFSSTDADAVLLIGDRAIQWAVEPGAPAMDPSGGGTREIVEVWDLGQKWCEWTGLPFVFAMWIAREEVDPAEVAPLLARARDEGTANLAEIARREAPALAIEEGLAARYLRENLHFTLDQEEIAGLRRYHALCAKHDLAPQELPLLFEESFVDGCPAK